MLAAIQFLGCVEMQFTDARWIFGAPVLTYSSVLMPLNDSAGNRYLSL